MDLRAVVRLGEGLLVEHGLTGWRLTLDRAKRRAGACRFEERTISLSRHLMALYDEAHVRETLLHEIAHALVGPRHGHDAVWRAKAVEIGCSGARLVAPDAPRAPAPWRGVCPRGHTYERHRRPARPTSCARCDPRFDVDHLLRWTFHGREVAMGPRYERELRDLVDGTERRRLAGTPPAARPAGALPGGATGPLPGWAGGSSPGWSAGSLPEALAGLAALAGDDLPADVPPSWWQGIERSAAGGRWEPGADERWLLDTAGRRWEVEDPPFELADPPLGSRSRLEVAAAAGALTPGWRVRVAAPGKYWGREGTVVKSARTRYHVRTGRELLTVPFALVDVVAAPTP